MGVAEIIIGIGILIVSFALIALILLQEGRRTGISTISGTSDTFLSKNNSRTKQARLARFTKILVTLFFILTIVASVLALRK
ncbi:MAG TPA: preprotein translocase subunit SecG [Clostridiales bacterium]|nr:preprotein translocase subunit SecG [Clostridiales bacterium]